MTLFSIAKVVFVATMCCAGAVVAASSQQVISEKKVWITIGKDAMDTIQAEHSSLVPLTQFNFVGGMSQDVAIVSVAESKLEQLSEIMHHEFNRCGGYFFHDSLEQAQSYLETVQNVQPLLVTYTIDNPEGVNTLVGELSASNLSATVSTLSAFNNRYYTQQSGVDAANWIKNRWQTIGNGRADFAVELYQHSWQQPSVIATITGTTRPDEIVVIGGHLDSINQSNRTTGRAPGADDNASGIAVVTETLRAIIASGFKPERTIKFMGYAAEEVGLRGSNAIAQAFKSAGENVVGVAQFDMTGFQGTSNTDVVFMTDFTSSAQNQFMAQLLDTYHQDIIYGFNQCGYACSDHASWTNQGYPASIPFESNISDANPKIHTANDSSFDVNHSIKFAKLSATYIAELAKGGTGAGPTPTVSPVPTPTPTTPPTNNTLENNVAKTGLSAVRGDDIVYTLAVPAGSSNIRFDISGGTGDADLYVKFGATPTDTSYDCRPFKNGNNEGCDATSSGGIYYVRLKAYATFSGVRLLARYDAPNTTPGAEPIDETESGISVSRRQWKRYTQTLAEGYGTLTVTISGGSGDADLYVRQGSQPTTSSYDCRPYKNGNAEVCTINSPAAGVWHIGLYGYRAVSDLSLRVKADPK